VREVYRKTGTVVRRENEMLVRVDEAGESIEDGASFVCAPADRARASFTVDAEAVNEAANAIVAMVRPPLVLERMIVSDGVAEHEFGEKRWSERTRRIHLAIALAPYRALIDLAGFTLPVIERVVAALPRLRGSRDVTRIRMAENVGAAVLPSLIGRLPMQQWAAPHDGKGQWVANVAVDERVPPNWFRPSYRSRPIRAWFHLRVDPFGEIDSSLPEAIALLGPLHDRTVQVLCIDRNEAFAATVTPGRVFAAAPAPAWYPYAAGCFGAQLVM
jgi:hypothetical protein